jgi:hypothetical protein
MATKVSSINPLKQEFITLINPLGKWLFKKIFVSLYPLKTLFKIIGYR